MLIKINEKIVLLVMTGIGFYFAGCKKFVQVPPPSTQIVAASVFGDNAAATSALMGIYIAMQPESFSMSQHAGLLSDELTSASTSLDVQPYYFNSLHASSNIFYLGAWRNAYSYIYQVNAIIEGIRNTAGMSPLVEQQLTGEAEFLRAFWYFYLVNSYGDVPLAISTDYTTNELLRRTNKDDVYQQIITDLKEAKTLLNTNYVDGSDTAISQDRIRPNKAVASALLARAYLFTKDYAKAELESDSLMQNGDYQLVSDLNQVFLINSLETIWQLPVPSLSTYSTVDGNSYILTSAPSGGDATARTSTISSFLWNSFEPNDQRKQKWIGSVVTSNPTDTFYFPFKYKSNSLPVTEYTMMLRLAEQYLIHAESLVRQNKNLDLAANDLNAIRRRAGLNDYAGPLDSDSLLTAILHERQTELFTEWGHRWFDLIRTGNINQVMNIVNPQKGGAGWNQDWASFPIPQSEIIKDHNLVQNPGY